MHGCNADWGPVSCHLNSNIVESADLSHLHMRTSSLMGTPQTRVHLSQREGIPACMLFCQSISYPLLALPSLTVTRDNEETGSKLDSAT